MIRERLEAYRRQKRKEEMKESLLNNLKSLLPSKSSKTPEEEPLNEVAAGECERLKENIRVCSEEDSDSTCSTESIEQPQNNTLKIVIYLLYFLLWVTVYIIAIEQQFGIVYFIISMFVFLWLSTSTRTKKKDEPSAYSVFNPNCEAIQGTFDAKQIENQIRFGMY